MKTLLTFTAIMLMAGLSFGQNTTANSGGCKCGGTQKTSGQASCCSANKTGEACSCATHDTSFVSTSASRPQDPQHQDHQQADQKEADNLSQADQLQIAVQGICPVTGEALGSMGEPIKVQVGEQIAFLCCKGCQDKELNAEHWKTIQANIASAQGTCPIMGKPVDSSMKSTVVKGQQVFVCCPPCIEKIQADPEAALTKVNASQVSFVTAKRQAHSDHLHMIAQGICPVSGEKLGSMGEPIKVRVGEEEVAFLCCKGCVGKDINADHWKTIQSNLAAAQGVCPVMEEPVDASMKSTVVNGRKIFVCCPPCIEKIQADPTAFLAKVDSQIAANTNAEAHHAGDGHDHAEHANDHKHDK